MLDSVSGETCPDCGSTYYRDGHCLVCPTKRMLEQRRQMRERSGPEYDKAVTRSKASHALWVEAGSPPRLSRGGIRSSEDGTYRRAWVLSAPLRRGEVIEATPEQIAASERYLQLLREQMPDMLREREQKKARPA
jgi:hypothetical protein